jgi:hypothetical protein
MADGTMAGALPACERVAVLADVHGNLPALNAVLAEPDVRAAQAVVLLGDIALGPMPGETLDRLAELGEQAVWVHGNCEREMVAAFDGGTVPSPASSQTPANPADLAPDATSASPAPARFRCPGAGVGTGLPRGGRRHASPAAAWWLALCACSFVSRCPTTMHPVGRPRGQAAEVWKTGQHTSVR